MLSITLDVPSELSTPLSISGYNQEKLTEEAKRLLAVSLFERNILSLGQADKIGRTTFMGFYSNSESAGDSYLLNMMMRKSNRN